MSRLFQFQDKNTDLREIATDIDKLIATQEEEVPSLKAITRTEVSL